MRIHLDQLPFIYDIQPRYLWVAPVIATGAYLLPFVIKKLFPLNPDNGLLSVHRTRFAQIHHHVVRYQHPHYYHFLHVVLKDNLPLAIFLVTLNVCKDMNKSLRGEYLYMMVVIPVTCLILTVIRDIAEIALLEISRELRSRQYTRVAQITNTCAVMIASSVV